MTKIYFDTCCLNRPFDEQTQERIRLESEAVLAILSRIEKGEWDWVGSDVLTDEIEQTPDTQKLSRAKLLFCILPVLRPQKRTCIYQQMTACSNWQKECQSVCIYE